MLKHTAVILAAALPLAALAQPSSPPRRLAPTPVPAEAATEAPAEAQAKTGRPAPGEMAQKANMARVRVWDLDGKRDRARLRFGFDDMKPGEQEYAGDGRTEYRLMPRGTRRFMVSRGDKPASSADYQLGVAHYSVLSEPLQNVDQPTEFPSRLLLDTFRNPAEGSAAVRLLLVESAVPVCLEAGTRTLAKDLAPKSHTGFLTFDPAVEPLALRIGSDVVVLDGTTTKPEAGKGYTVLVRSVAGEPGAPMKIDWLLLPESSGVADPDNPFADPANPADNLTGKDIRDLREKRRELIKSGGMIDRKDRERIKQKEAYHGGKTGETDPDSQKQKEKEKEGSAGKP
ncbi:MAG: hypothetical protein SF028_08785 [Candidatus Sumerlaeia bacterium]|nr:hypothetical protein [Candidatus Sumerlaeia bacterium]